MPERVGRLLLAGAAWASVIALVWLTMLCGDSIRWRRSAGA